MNTINITPGRLLEQYAGMTKNEILLHMALCSLTTSGKMKRNLLMMCRMLNKSEQRLRDAEYGLKQRGLLRIHWVSGKRWWYVYTDPIVGSNLTENTDSAVPATLPAVREIDTRPKPRGIFGKIYDILAGK